MSVMVMMVVMMMMVMMMMHMMMMMMSICPLWLLCCRAPAGPKESPLL